MGSFPLMFIYCILYHFWDVRRILLPPPRQIRRDLSTTFSTSIAKQPISTSPTLQHSPLRFSKDGSSLLRKSIFLQARSRLVGYCIFKYAIRKQYIKNLSVLPSLRINSNAEQGIAQPAATRSKTVSTDLPPGLSALTWCPDLVPRLSPDCAPTGHACRVVYAAINARLSRRIGSDDTAPESPLRSAAHSAASIRTRPISDIACSQMASKG